MAPARTFACISGSGAWEELFVNIARLQELQPSFVSVTYGAGGSTRERTHDLVVRIHRETNLTAVSHLTCVCHQREELAAILDRYAASGIENIMALSGDPNNFAFAGHVYPSLSAVAKAITGSHCNGFLFSALARKGDGHDRQHHLQYYTGEVIHKGIKYR